MANPNSSISGTGKIIAYSFPDMGTVQAILHREAAVLYDFLNSIKEIERLEHLDHLGKLREVHKSAHYSRWEYVVLQLCFIDVIKEAEKTWGLSQSVEINNFDVSSGEELIKCWVLLLNFSHLHGVFDAERVWLELLLEDDQLQNTLIDAIPSEIVKKELKRVFQMENFYALHKYMGLALLYHLKRYTKEKWPFALWTTMLEGYLSSPLIGSKIWLCKSIFERIRKLVFIALDLNHCSLGIRINQSLLLNRIKENPSEFLYEEDSSFAQHTDALERILFQNVYGEPRIVQYRANYILEQKQKYYRLVADENNKKIRSSKKHLCQKILQAHWNDFGKIKKVERFTHYLRTDLLPDKVFAKESIRYYTEQQWLDKKSGLISWRFIVTPIAFANRGGCTLDVFVEGDTSRQDQATIFWTLVKYTSRYFKEFSFDSQFYCYLVEDYVKDLFSHIINKVLRTGYSFRFQSHTSPIDYNVHLAASSSEIRKWKYALGSAIKKTSLQSDRKYELLKLKDLLSKKGRGAYLVCCSRIRVFDSQFRQVAEFDGVFARILKHTLEIVFLEAKKGITIKSDRARKDLKEALNAALAIGGPPRIIRRKGLAYAIVSFEKNHGHNSK